VLNLTDVERRILINQSRILAALYPLETLEFERTAEILSEGYHEDWPDTVLRGLKTPLLKEEMNFVSQVLATYDWLQKSYYALTLDEKLRIKEQMLVFPGFEAQSEPEYLSYAQFLVENFARFSVMEVAKPLNSRQAMRGAYREMLNRFPAAGGALLAPSELKAAVAFVSEMI
jgi:uncharacterized protein YfbU (UPF0304 family)